MERDVVIRVESIVTQFGDSRVHEGVSLAVERGTVVAIIASSGGGKTVLLREMIGLLRPTEGRVEVFGTDLWRAGPDELAALRRRMGVLFQGGALFSALTVGENVVVPLLEQARVSEDLIPHIVALKLALVGLPKEVYSRMPSELSGGMVKRAALARALALDPEILFLDEPTSGLDPVSAREFDDLLRSLCRDLGLTVVMTTHDIDTLLTAVDRVIVLGGGRVIADGRPKLLVGSDEGWIREYFDSRRTIPAHSGPQPRRPALSGRER